MSIILITGIMAAGKSTVAQALAERLPRSVHVRGDQFRRFIVNGREEMDGIAPSDEAVRQLQLRYQLAADAARSYADAGFTVVLQDIYLETDLPAMVERLQPHPVHVVVLCPSQDSVRARDAHRQATRGKIAYQPGGIDVYLLDKALRNTPQIGLWLDTSDLSVEETVDEILHRLANDSPSPDRARG